MNLNFFRFRIVNAEGFYGDFFHYLRSHGAVGIISLCFRDAVHIFHAFDHFAESGICSVQMRGVLMHDEEVWKLESL